MKLIALFCPSCRAALDPKSDEVVAMRCAECETAVSITDNGLQQISPNWGIPSGEGDITHWLPFWQISFKLNMTKRVTQGGSGSAGRAAQKFWQAPHSIYVPAWTVHIPRVQDMIIGQFRRERTYVVGDPPTQVEMTEATLTVDDSLKLLDMTVLTFEARRADYLKDIAYAIEPTQTALWILPGRHKTDDDKILAQEILG